MDRTFEDVEDGSDLNFDETAAGIDFPGVGRSTRVRVPTERGLDFQLTLKRKNYNQCKIDCKTVGFFLKISKEIGKAWRKSLTRAKRASLTRP